MMRVVLAQTETTAVNGGAILVFLLIGLAFFVLVIAALWAVFAKAGQPGWAAIIPFYNLYILLKIAERPAWWMVLLLVPIVSFVILIIVYIDLAKAFDKGAGFGVGLIFLGFVFFPILGFGSARYVGISR